MASFMFGAGRLALTTAGGTITFVSDTIKFRLVKSSVTPVITATVMTGLTAVTGTTDQTLGSKTSATDSTQGYKVKYTGANSTWTAVASGDTVGWVVGYKFVTNDADSVPIVCIDVTDTPTNGGDIVAPWSANGIFTL